MVFALKVGRNTQLLAVTRRISNPSQNSGSVAVLSLRNSLLIDATWTRVPATDSEPSLCFSLPTINTAAFPSRNEDFPENLLIKWQSHAGDSRSEEHTSELQSLR